jgi:hypothetical protein
LKKAKKTLPITSSSSRTLASLEMEVSSPSGFEIYPALFRMLFPLLRSRSFSIRFIFNVTPNYLSFQPYLRGTFLVLAQS